MRNYYSQHPKQIILLMPPNTKATSPRHKQGVGSHAGGNSST